MDKNHRLRAIKNLVIQLVFYGAFIAFYAVAVLQFLSDPVTHLYHDNLTLYAWFALFLVVGQGVLLDMVTSFLVNRLRLSRFD